MPKTINVLSLFSGCGGMDLGFEGGFMVPRNSMRNPSWISSAHGDFVKLKKTGFKTVFACDIKPDAKLAWESYFDRRGVFHNESIVDMVRNARSGLSRFPSADIVTGGFPCQDFSVAGKRNGFNSHKTHANSHSDGGPSIESRGMLYYWMREVIDIVRPKIFVAENVKGLASLGDAKDVIASDFRSVGGGYLVLEPMVLHAGDYGVPQMRERIIFIGVRKDGLSQQNIEALTSGELSLYPDKTHACGDMMTVRDALRGLPEPEGSEDPSHASYSRAKWYGKHCQGQTEINMDGLGPTIRSEHHGNIEFRRLSKENGGKIIDEYGLPQRRLSVRECARIQTFPDNYRFVGGGVSASNAYKLVGNAVPPLLAYHIAMRLKSSWNTIFPSERV